MRPNLLFACHPLTGHITPVLRIAAGLRQRGWRIAFLSSEFFRARIEAADLQFFPLLGAAALDDNTLFDRRTGQEDGETKLAEGLSPEVVAQLPQSVTDSRFQTLYALPAEWDSLKAALAALIDQYPGEKVRLVTEAFFYGAVPSEFDAPLPAAVAAAWLPGTVCISITAPALKRDCLPPFGEPGQFDHSEEGRKKYAAIWKDEWLPRVAPLTELLRKKMLEAGAAKRLVEDIVYMNGFNYHRYDSVAQIGLREFEYPDCGDLPVGFLSVGVLPPVVPAAVPDFPWWSELLENQDLTPHLGRKKVVVVAQGTVETEPTELILPTLEVLADREDVITIAILGVRGASIANTATFTLPANSRVADYLSYDSVLPFADLWVHNGGYGATMHGIANGVPMVLAGDTQDKPESAKRVHQTHLGLDLRTGHPSKEVLRTAIDHVLLNPDYGRVAKTMQTTAQLMDPIESVESMILHGNIHRQRRG